MYTATNPYRPNSHYRQKENHEDVTEENTMEMEETTQTETNPVMDEDLESDVVQEESDEDNTTTVNILESANDILTNVDLDAELTPENNEYQNIEDLFVIDFDDKTIYDDKINLYLLPLYDLKRLVNVLSLQDKKIGEELVIFKNENSKSIIKSLTEDNLITYELLKDDHDFSFKGKEVFIEVIELLIKSLSEQDIYVENLDEFYGLSVPSMQNTKTVKRADVLTEINLKLDKILEMLND